MSATVNQPNMNPTNKLGSAVAVTGLMAAVQWIFNFYWPERSADTANLVAGLTPFLVLVIGWLVPDAPNVVTTPTVLATEVSDAPAKQG